MRPSIASPEPEPSTTVVLSLSIVTFLALPRSSSVMASSLMPRSSLMTLPPAEDRDVFEHCLAAIAKAGSFNSSDIQVCRAVC